MELDTTTRLLVMMGVAAPFLFAVTTIVGAAIRPGYSHMANAVSELVGAGAPNRLPLNIGFLIYNVLVVAFASGIVTAFDDAPIAMRLSGWILAATGVVGAIMWPFPMDRIRTPATPRGIGHIVLAGFASIGTMTAVLSFAIGASDLPGWEDFSTYSYVALAVIVVTGAIAAAAAIRLWPTMGLMERLTIGAGLQWMAMLAVTLLS
jgi:hypothetical membrane protein